MLPIKPVCERYGITAQTVDRWLEQDLLPQPMRVRRYRYWSESELDEFDQKRMDTQREAQSSSRSRQDAKAKAKSEHIT
jgi:DNA-binding transcriptional MerR regulator